MNEDYGAARRENEIGDARHPTVMQPIAEAKRMNKATHDHFRFGILGANEGHALATLAF